MATKKSAKKGTAVKAGGKKSAAQKAVVPAKKKTQDFSATVSYHSEFELPVPDTVQRVKLRIEILPASGGCLVYGKLANGNFGCYRAIGPVQEVDLPFVNPKLYLHALGGAQSLKIKALHWVDDGGKVRKPA